MKKLTALFLAVMALLSVTGCGIGAPKTETYVIPESYWEYAGTTPEKAVESFEKLGTDYYTTAQVVEDGVQVELTTEQRDRLVQRNNEYNEKLIADFLDYDSDYRYVPDETYQKLSFYFDEKIPPFLHVKTVYNLVAGYGMNYILQNNTTDWNVELSVYNCHTEKLVVKANCPYETVTCGPEEWKASYNE